MELILIICGLVVGVLILILQVLNIAKSKKSDVNFDNREIEDCFKAQEKSIELNSKYSTEILLKSLENLNAVERERISDLSNRVEELIKSNEIRFENLRRALFDNVKVMTDTNKEQLEMMRNVVDEKLNTTLEHRLNNSFEIINTRLEAVYKGLGEMQNLAKGVGDIKSVLTNVKTRGTWAEVQLENLLSQMLSPEQYLKQVKVKRLSDERVDFAIRLPGKDTEVFLPLDSKFPLEEYQRLIDASAKGDFELTEKCHKGLETRIKDEAKKISQKYIYPPVTTDFAIMYLPLEGLFAEIAKNTALVETLQRDFRIVVCGPTTLGALLNSLQMGFKTVAIEKRSSELWKLLSVFKREFIRFSELLSKTQKKLKEATDSIDDAAKKTRTIETKLKTVDILDNEENTVFLEKQYEEEDNL